MKLSDFYFDLPEELIALRPVAPRDAARLLVVRGPEGITEDRYVRDLPRLLDAGDILIANNTRVLKAALSGHRPSRTHGEDIPISVNLNMRLSGSEWSAFARPGKRLKPGDVIRFAGGLEATVTAKSEAEVRLAFNREGAALDTAVDAAGEMPIPPYIGLKRPVDAADVTDYQTTFARETGSVAAPTAGLHFTPELLVALEAAGVRRADVTLHVNAGTFLPVKTEELADHKMHAEHAEISAETASAINAAREAGGRCVAIGTTALRTLESAAAGGKLAPFRGETSIFIKPGYRFRTVDALMTNFHLPKSTLFVLVSALMGREVMQRAYAHAIRKRYRFFSYGDACLLLPEGSNANG
jgi:S-adenosylmethionine:tRNA ribosyltransferase-isomerase